MKKKIITALLLNCFAILLSKTAVAELKINEIYPAPKTGEYEWVEFYNPASSSADLSNYLFDDDSDFNSDASSSAKVTLSGVLPRESTCYLQLSNYLNNNGDSPTLFKADASVVDNYTYTTTQTGKSHSRIPDGAEWQVNVDPTQSLTNCLNLVPTPPPSLTITSTPTATLAPSETPTPTSEPPPESYTNIYLTEAMVYPVSGQPEWVEIYNNNDFPVYLTNWYIDDVENAGSSPKMFSLEIGSKSYGVFELTSSIFNNSSDSVRLLDFNKSFKDGFEYPSAIQGKTYGRIFFDSDDFCLQEESKGLINNNCLNPTATTTLNPTASPTTAPTQKPTLSLSSSKKTVMSTPQYIQLNNIHQGKVLGFTTANPIKRKTNKPLINSLSFLSFSYSFLTIFSTLIKIKRRYEESL